MKKILITLSVLLNILAIAGLAYAASRFGSLQDGLALRSERLVSQFQLLEDSQVDVVFLGDSITEGGKWQEWFPGVSVANRGIGGNTTGDVLARVEQVIALAPDKLFLMIGINDLNRQLGPEIAINNYAALFDRFDEKLPDTHIYIQSVLPVNDQWPLTTNDNVPALNAALQREADTRGYTYINLAADFADKEGQLDRALSNDGIHLMGSGYQLWQQEIADLVHE